MSTKGPVRLKPPRVQVKERRKIWKLVAKLRKVKPSRPGK